MRFITVKQADRAVYYRGTGLIYCWASLPAHCPISIPGPIGEQRRRPYSLIAASTRSFSPRRPKLLIPISRGDRRRIIRFYGITTRRRNCETTRDCIVACTSREFRALRSETLSSRSAKSERNFVKLFRQPFNSRSISRKMIYLPKTTESYNNLVSTNRKF